MVYTVTLNPSLDYVVHLERLEKGALNRTQAEEIQCGGKGVNVSVVLSRLGVDTTALGFAAGFTGMALKDLLRQKNIDISEDLESNMIFSPDFGKQEEVTENGSA